MSDGPHKTLPMRSRWKALSRRADNGAFSVEDVAEAVCPALARDWSADVSDTLLRQLKAVLGGENDGLFPDQTTHDLQNLQTKVNSPMEALLVDAACDAANDGLLGQIALERAVTEALFERGLRGIRQVEEHWLRETSNKRAVNVRSRLEAAIASAPIGQLTTQLLDGADVRQIKPIRRGSVEDGAPL